MNAKTISLLLIVSSLVTAAPLAAQDGEFEKIIEFGRGVPRDIQWHPSGEMILVDTVTGAWVYSGDTLETRQHFEALQSASFSPDGRWLMGTNATGETEVRAVETGELVALPAGFTKGSFSPDGRWLFGQDGKQQNVLLETETFQPVWLPKEYQSGVFFPIWSPDSYRLILADKYTFMVWRLGETQLDWSMTTDYPGWQRWSPDGSKILKYNNTNNYTQIWDSETGDLLTNISVQPLPKIRYENEQLWGPDWMPDSKRIILFYASENSAPVQVFDAATGQKLVEWEESNLYGIAFSPDGKWFARSFGLYSAATFRLKTNFDAYDFEWSPDSQFLAVPADIAPQVELISPESGQVVRTLTTAGSIWETGRWVKWSPDSTRLITWDSTGIITLFDVASGQQLAAFYQHLDYSTAAFSFDGSLLAVADKTGGVWLWDVPKKQLITTLQGYQDEVEVLAWQPGGRLLAAQNRHSTMSIFSPEVNLIRVWDGTTGQLVDMIDGFVPIRWSPDGNRLYTGTGMYDNNVQTWDAITHLRHKIKVSVGYVYVASPASISWSPDNSIMGLDYYDRGLRLYEYTDDQLLAAQLEYHTKPTPQWNADSTRLTLVSVDCPLNADKNCTILFRTIFDRTNPPGDKLVKTGEIPPEATLGPYLSRPDFVWSPNGLRLAITNIDDKTVEIWDAHQRPPQRLLLVEQALGTAWNSDSTRIEVRHTNGQTASIDIIEIYTGQKLASIDQDTMANWVSNSNFIVTGDYRALSLWDTSTGKLVKLLEGTAHIMAYDDNLFVEIASGVMHVWERKSS